MKKIDINGKIWEYHIGRSNVVARSDDDWRMIDNKTLSDSIAHQNDSERGEWKQHFSEGQIGDWLRSL